MKNLATGHIAVLIALAATALLRMLAGNLFINHLDEGIYLEGAARMASGDVIYRDFFALTGPGTYWLTSTLFRLFGTTLSVARWAPLAGLGALTGVVYYLAARFTSRGFAVPVTFAYFGFMVANTDMMVVNHRLDSAVFGALAVALSVAGWPAAAGAAAAFAAWATPPMLALVAVILVWRFRTGGWKAYAAGVAACSCPLIAWLAWSGALAPMTNHLLWSASNYSGANRVFYGFIVGGWAALFNDAEGAELAIRGIFIGYCLMLPAILPLIALAASIFRRWANPDQWFVAFCGAALVASSYPRPSVTNLRYLSALFVVLAATLLYRSASLRTPVIAVPALLSLALLWTAIQTSLPGEHIQTPRGIVRAAPGEAPALRQWLKTVQPGTASFAFPYQPIALFLTAALNPTHYNYLQPGMMTEADERSVLADFERNPPEWVHYTNIPPAAYMRIWPTSDPSRLKMPRIEAFLQQRYRVAHTVQENGLPVQILQLRR